MSLKCLTSTAAYYPPIREVHGQSIKLKKRNNENLIDRNLAFIVFLNQLFRYRTLKKMQPLKLSKISLK